MLKWLAEDREREACEGKVHLDEGERLYKPIFIALPAGVLDQCFNEINRDWSGVFDVYSFYGHPGIVCNAARAAKTLSSFPALQNLVDSLAEKSNDPKVSRFSDTCDLLLHKYRQSRRYVQMLTYSETGRTIILAPYTTITWRMTERRETVWVPQSGESSLDSEAVDQKDEDIAAPKLPAESNSNETPEGKETEASKQGPEVQKRERFCKLVNSDWSVIIADDCHSLKNPCSTIHKLIASLPRESILFVSANPLSNHVRDIIGYLDLIWNPAWPFSYNEKGKEKVNDYYHPDGWNQIKECGKFESITYERLVTRNGEPYGSLEPSSRNKRLAQEYESFIREGKAPLHLLNPLLFQHYAVNNNWSTNVSAGAVKTIMDMISLNRGMLTQMAMPDGTMTCLGKNLKGMTVRTIELQPLEVDKPELSRFCESLSIDLIRQQEFIAPEMVVSGAVITAPKQFLNTSAMRRLMCVSTDLGNKALTDNGGRSARLVNKTRLANILRTNKRGDKNVAQRLAIQRENEKPLAAGGFSEVDGFHYGDNTGGLKYHFYSNRPSGAYSFPINRPAQVKVVAYHSPKYCYAINEALDAQEKGQKLLCYVNCPLTSQ